MNKLKWINECIEGLQYHDNYDVINHFLTICIDSNDESLHTLILHLFVTFLSYPKYQVRYFFYTNLVKLMNENNSIKLLSILLNSDVLYQILYYGLCDEQVREISIIFP